MRLTSVYDHHNRIEVLFDLLKERDESVNISHINMPNYGEHLRFVESRPYKAWYMIEAYGVVVGAIYLSKQDEIGVFIRKDHQGNGYGPWAIQEVMKLHGDRRYLANINPSNTRSVALFGKLGFKHIQNTYELRSA